MAAKKTNKKPSMDQPPIGDDLEWSKQINRRQNLQRTIQSNLKAGNNPGEVLRLNPTELQNIKNQIKAINSAEEAYVGNQVKYPSFGVIEMGPGFSDSLSGRTPEGGTRSLLEGFKAFIRGGGLIGRSK